MLDGSPSAPSDAFARAGRDGVSLGHVACPRVLVEGGCRRGVGSRIVVETLKRRSTSSNIPRTERGEMGDGLLTASRWEMAFSPRRGKLLGRPVARWGTRMKTHPDLLYDRLRVRGTTQVRLHHPDPAPSQCVLAAGFTPVSGVDFGPSAASSMSSSSEYAAGAGGG